MTSLDPTLRSWLDTAANSTLVCCLLYVALWIVCAVRVRVRRTRRIRAAALPRLLPLVGLAIAAGPRHDDSPRDSLGPPRHSPHVAPWSESDGWFPPRPSDSDPPSRPAERLRSGVPSAHPAIHPERRSDDRVHTPLFERASRTIKHVHSERRYVVVAGDSLWKIAQRELRTGDPVAIRDYWREIFEVNRSVLGANADLIYPGQKIKLPGHRN